MYQELKNEFIKDLERIKEAVTSSSVVDLRERVGGVIDEVKGKAIQRINQLEVINQQADRIADPIVEKIMQSRWTAVIMISALFGGVLIGVVIGMSL